MNLDVEYSVRRSDRARRARIQVTADGVEVIVPRRLPMREVEPFIAEKKPWIERTLRRLREAEAERPATELEDGGQVPYLGEMLLLRVKVEPSRTRAHVARRGEVLVVKVAGPGPEPVADALEALVPPPGPRRGRAAAGRRLRPRRDRVHEALDPRPAHALGQLLVLGRHELQLAAAAGARPRSWTTWSSTRSAT